MKNRTAGSIHLDGYKKLMYEFMGYKNQLVEGMGATDICRNIFPGKK